MTPLSISAVCTTQPKISLSKRTHIIIRRSIKNNSFICVENKNKQCCNGNFHQILVYRIRKNVVYEKNGIWKAVYMVSIFWCWYHFTGVKKENTTLCTFEKRKNKNKNNCSCRLWRDKRSRIKIKTVCSIAEPSERVWP